MLANLCVKNVALIDNIDVEFSKGLNILTGETGAGKSIILGAVNLALGKKMNSEMIGNFGDYALVELVFLVESKRLMETLSQLDIICEDNQLILSRKVMEGKSLCKINSETCTTAQMRAVASLLLDVHGQMEHQKLLVSEQQLEILDDFTSDKIARLKSEIAREYEQWQVLKREASQFDLNDEERERELSFLKFEVNEIEAAGLQPDEDVALEKTYKRLNNSKKIAAGLSSAYNATGGDDQQSASNLISSAIKDISSVANFDEELDNVHKMLLDVESMLGDCNREISSYMQGATFSEQEFSEIEERLNLVNNLKSKYGPSLYDVAKYCKAKSDKLEELGDFANRKAKVCGKVKEQEEILETLCAELSTTRKDSAKEFEQQLVKTLGDLNFNAVDFEISFSRLDRFTKEGYDQVEFLISTNSGEAKKPLGKVASGGELSRIMLGVKTLIADKEDAQTQIFDEIDVGISGRTAQKVAEKMELIARRRQVICITHLPQIAAMADAHYEIAKEVNDNKTTTQIFKLDEAGEIGELARMLGGAQITDSVCENAREMKALANSHKMG